RPPISSRAWLPLSATECTPSASIDDDPVMAAATNLLAAIPRFAASAVTTALVLPSTAIAGRSARSMARTHGPVAIVSSRRTSGRTAGAVTPAGPGRLSPPGGRGPGAFPRASPARGRSESAGPLPPTPAAAAGAAARRRPTDRRRRPAPARYAG